MRMGKNVREFMDLRRGMFNAAKTSAAYAPRSAERIAGNRRVAKIVAGGGIGAGVVNAASHRSGRPADRMGRGRSTGMYGY